ncbi:MAG: 23S rRNA (uracil(1939)-C(5))-methyltransferase RlmD [Oscillospiraceae bacterium]|nr:23S rRNA (uracil(1939)-C(5))-methyltransferase RlmD [Oscillospiraceae bacterium]
MPLVDITGLNDQGQGVARLDNYVVFVDNAVPGDAVEIEMTERRSKYGRAVIKAIDISSPSRIDPICPHVGSCGGCPLGMMKYERQLDFKTQTVRDKLIRLGGLSPDEFVVEPTIPMNYPYKFRNKVSFPVGGDPQDPKIGLYAGNSHDIVPVDSCPVIHPVAELIPAVMRDFIRDHNMPIYNPATGKGLIRHIIVRVSYTTGEVMVILVLTQDTLPSEHNLIMRLLMAVGGFNPTPLEHPPCRLASLYVNINPGRAKSATGQDCRLVYGKSYIEETLLGMRYRISPLSFFQTNTIQAQVLFREVLGATVLTADQIALDLHCGTGSIALLLAQRAGAVIGIDISPDAIRDAQINAREAGLESFAQFVNASAGQWIKAYVDSKGECYLAVLDPPRKGCDQELLDALLGLAPPRIVYVSCNPATLARDIALLKEDYRVCSVQPVDMFPWTPHVETVLLMTRIDRGKEQRSSLLSRAENALEEFERYEDMKKQEEWEAEKEELMDALGIRYD